MLIHFKRQQTFPSFIRKSLFLFLCLSTLCYAEEDCKKDQTQDPHPPKIGNFAVPGEVPGALVSFGQRNPDKGGAQLSLFFDYFAGKKKHLTELWPTGTYGMTEDLAVTFTAPFSVSERKASHSSSGIEDAFLQLEYVTYESSTVDYEDYSTIVGSVSFPTGSTKKTPPTGLGSSSFFAGWTYVRTYTDWLWFLSDGIIFPTHYEGSKAGNVFLYQGAVGRNIFSVNNDMSLAWLVEANGFYTQKSKFKSRTDHNSGGNVIYLVPSLQLCVEHLLFQMGFGVPVVQRLNGHQNKDKYMVVTNFIWTF